MAALTFISFMGISSGKDWKSVTTNTYSMVGSYGKWITQKPVPGTAGRLGAVAVPIGEQIFLFGGYVLDAQGEENTIADVNVYERCKNGSAAMTFRKPSAPPWLGLTTIASFI